MMDYYEILGIDKHATQEQIKASYRALAKKYHPDVNDAPNAAAFFRLIQEAYETLSDSRKREEYNNCKNKVETHNVESDDDMDDDVKDNSTNYVSFSSYREYNIPIESDRRSDIPIIELLITIAFVALITNLSTHIHPVFCILIGIVFSVILTALFQTRVGWWIVSMFFSAMWAALAGELARELSHGDWIWFWGIFGFVFLISLMVHRNKLDT